MVRVVKFSELDKCWAPIRLFNSCLSCNRYDTCTYPERQFHIAYHHNRQERSRVAARLAVLDTEATTLQTII
jgi:hypothetical protein